MEATGPAGAEADRLAVEAQYPGWDVSLSGLGRWYAQRREPIGGWVRFRPQLGADDPAGLLAALAAFGRA